MVPVSGPIASTIARLQADLTERLREQWVWPSPQAGFALHVFAAAGYDHAFAIEALEIDPNAMARFTEAPILAAGGYAIGLARDSQLPSVRAAWSEGFRKLSTRQAFPRGHESFFFRSTELVGIALGAVVVESEDSEPLHWLRSVLHDGQRELSDAPAWSAYLAAYVADVLGVHGSGGRTAEPTSFEPEELALMIWMCTTKNALAAELGFAARQVEYETALLERLLAEPLRPLDIARVAVLLVGVRATVRRFVESATERYWQFGRETQDALELVRQLCARFHLLALQLQHRQRDRLPFPISDEYDVQDLLHGVLRLHFDDVRPEEWTPSYAGNASRTDFLLKSERIAVEAKMTRAGLGQREVVDQLIIDITRYGTHPDCETLVCVIYDPGHRLNNPAALERDISRDQGRPRVAVVVVPRGV